MVKNKKNVDWFLIILLFSAFFLRLFFLFYRQVLLWDSGVYIGMGKFIFSLGRSGLFEHIRPVIVPFVLGFFWKLGLDPVFFGKLFEIVLGSFSVGLLYVLAKSWFGKRTAVFAGVIFAFSPLFFYLSFHQYTEIPALFFVLLSLWFFDKSFFVSGLFLGVAFLTKFLAGIFLPIFIFVLFFKKDFKSMFFLVLGFLFVSLPYLFFSWFFFGSPFASLLAAHSAIKRVLGCNVLRFKPWWFYFEVFFKESWLYLFLVFGLLKSWFEKVKNYLLLLLCFFVPFVYLSLMHCRDYRYAALFLPFAAVFAGKGIDAFVGLFGKYRKVFFVFAVFIVFFVSVFSAISFFFEERVVPSEVQNRFFSFFDDKGSSGEIWVSNPSFAAYSDFKFYKIYYPVYDNNLSLSFHQYIQKNFEKISFVALENCGGGIICLPDDVVCLNSTAGLISFLDSKFRRVFDEQHGRCWYRIWSNV
ncbi:hypothetical protein DRJ22_00315 [Candidatus Woesearchaeota archaeon]|nr:MAG: hypothetical protein DRJ22_00315 [Candidatus Woesearchaeota archaeon]